MKPNLKYARLTQCSTILLGIVAGCDSVPTIDDASVPPQPQKDVVAPEASEDIVLAVVDGVELTLSDALDAFLSSHMGHGSLVQGEPAIRELTGRIIERRLFLAEAETLAIPEVEDIVAAVELRRMELAEGLFWKQEVDERIEVSEQEVEDFYSRTDMALTVHYLEVEERDAAEALRQRVVEGADFEELAREQSTHPSRDFGGLMGYLRRGDLERAIEDEIFALEEAGAVTPVVATKAGFAFARFEAKTTNPDRPAREVAIPQIRSVLKEQAKEKLTEEVEERLLREAGVTFEESMITRELVLATTDPDVVVARAGEEELTLAELRDSLDLEAVRRSPDEAAVGEALLDIARDWARGWAVQQALVAAGLTTDPSIVPKVERYREDIELGWLYSNFIYVDVTTDEEEIRAYYDANKDEIFTRPEEIRLAYIVVETEEEAQVILRRVADGEDFGEIAKEESIDPASAALGGKISWVRKGQIIREVEEPAFAMEVGEYGGPIPTEYGWFVLHVLERKQPALVPYEVCKRMAETRLTQEKKSEAPHAFWAVRLRERADVEVREEGVRQAVAWLEREAEMEAAAKAAEEEAARAAEEEAAREMVGPMPVPEEDANAQEDSGGSR